MKRLSKVFNILSTISILVSITLLFLFNIFVNGVHLNGYVVLILLFMILNPIANLCRINKKVINNPIYHIILIILSSYVSIISIKCLMVFKNYYKEYDSDFLNNSVNYFGDRFILVVIFTILVLLLSFLFKKIKVERKKDNSTVMLLILILTSVISLFGINQGDIIPGGLTLSNFIFGIIILIKLNSINTVNELQKYYLILILLSLFSFNSVALILSIYMFLGLDKFGLNI